MLIELRCPTDYECDLVLASGCRNEETNRHRSERYNVKQTIFTYFYSQFLAIETRFLTFATFLVIFGSVEHIISCNFVK